MSHLAANDDADQICSSSRPSTKQQPAVYQRIKMDIDMLLDSEDDEYEKEMNYQDDGMIEKDLDNWI